MLLIVLFRKLQIAPCESSGEVSGKELSQTPDFAIENGIVGEHTSGRRKVHSQIVRNIRTIVVERNRFLRKDFTDIRA